MCREAKAVTGEGSAVCRSLSPGGMFGPRGGGDGIHVFLHIHTQLLSDLVSSPYIVLRECSGLTLLSREITCVQQNTETRLMGSC